MHNINIDVPTTKGTALNIGGYCYVEKEPKGHYEIKRTVFVIFGGNYKLGTIITFGIRTRRRRRPNLKMHFTCV